MAKRPWEKAGFEETCDRVHAVCRDTSSVELDDGTIYKSDRFYLHAAQGDEDITNPNDSKNHNGNSLRISDSTTSPCTCGARRPPPLFDREKLLQSLELEAAILGTFTVDLKWMSSAFPQLVGRQATVPTLILHGQKGLTKQTLHEVEDASVDGGSSDSNDDLSDLQNSEELYHRKSQVEQKGSLSGLPLPSFHIPQFSPVPKYKTKAALHDEPSVDEGASVRTQEECSQPVLRSPISISANETQKFSVPRDELNWSKKRSAVGGKFLHLTRVQSAWLRPADDSNRQVSRETPDEGIAQTKRESKFGVHHPKFMILFEKTGDVVLVVSTANLTAPKTTEGSWVQRFQRRKLQKINEHNCTMTRLRGISSSNDFGPVLTDFLHKLSQSAMVGHMTVDQFLNKYLNFGLNMLQQLYNFDDALVHLIPVIPGDYPVENSSKLRCKKGNKYKFRYGRQRVDHILANEVAVGRQEVLLHSSEKDRLVIQPTSFGGNWKRREMADVVRSYLSLEINAPGGDDHSVLDRLDIVWPSQAFMDTIHREERRRRICVPSSKSVAAASDHVIAKVRSKATPSEHGSSFVFMSSTTFNSCEETCISRMAMFESSDPPQRPHALAPHIKTLARCVRGKTERSRLKDIHGRAKEYFSWFMLTSSCLSLGAQGKSTTLPSPRCSLSDENVVSYANFELGILFTSRLNERHHGRQRLYCFKPRKCSCDTMPFSADRTLIHLPVPYNLRPKPYVNRNCEESADMVATPFLHDVIPETRCVGNMLLTPYGKSLMKKLSGKRKLKI